MADWGSDWAGLSLISTDCMSDYRNQSLNQKLIPHIIFRLVPLILDRCIADERADITLEHTGRGCTAAWETAGEDSGQHEDNYNVLSCVSVCHWSVLSCVSVCHWKVCCVVYLCVIEKCVVYLYVIEVCCVVYLYVIEVCCVSVCHWSVLCICMSFECVVMCIYVNRIMLWCVVGLALCIRVHPVYAYIIIVYLCSTHTFMLCIYRTWPCNHLALI